MTNSERYGPNGTTIRSGTVDDIEAMQAVEAAADTIFAAEDLPSENHVCDRELLHDALSHGRAWVAESGDGTVVGFAVVILLGDSSHLEQVSVHPDFGRRGLGRALVERAVEWARSGGYRQLTLSTATNVPWNRPFYEKLGFRVLTHEEMTDELRAVREEERELGHSVELRVLMAREL